MAKEEFNPLPIAFFLGVGFLALGAIGSLIVAILATAVTFVVVRFVLAIAEFIAAPRLSEAAINAQAGAAWVASAVVVFLPPEWMLPTVAVMFLLLAAGALR